MKNYDFNSNVIVKKKKNHNILRSALIIIASLAVVIAGVVCFSSIKPSNTLSLDFFDGQTHQVSSAKLNNGRLSEDLFNYQVEDGKYFSGWYYDSNYVCVAQAGDVISENTTLFGRQLSSVEHEYWNRVDNQLNAPEIGRHDDTTDESPVSPFSSKKGTGTEQDPYIISSSEDMGVFSKVVNYSGSTYSSFFSSASYKLANDVRLDTVDVTWPAVGSVSAFTGTLDGNGNMIYYIYGSQGLFKEINGATIKNLTIKGLKISATSTSSKVGGLAGNIVNSTISNCSIYVDINSNAELVGGLAGCVEMCSISNCSIYGEINNTSNNSNNQPMTGGIAGGSNYSNYNGCYSFINQTVVGASPNVGGIIGYSTENDSLYACANYGVIDTNSTNYNNIQQGVGGIIGYIYDSLTINHCINYGNISDIDGFVGGLVGNCYNGSSSISNSLNYGNISRKTNSQDGYIGGIVGLMIASDSFITNTNNLGTIYVNNNNSSVDVGGLVGLLKNATISNSYSLGNFELKNMGNSGNFGSIFGENNGATIVENCGYNNTIKVDGKIVQKADDNSVTYEGINNLYNPEKDSETNQQSLINALKNETAYNGSSSIFLWDIMYEWQTDILDFTGNTPSISKTEDFSVARNDVSYYINGLKKIVRTYKQTQSVTAPDYNGYTVSYYTDRTYTTKYSFGNRITSNLSLYGKCDEIEDGVKYNVSIDPDVTNVQILGDTQVTESHNVSLVLQTTEEDETISDVEVSMVNNSNPEYEYIADTKTITIKNVCGNVVITPIFKDPLPTPAVKYVENVVYIDKVTGGTDYFVDVYKDNVLKNTYTASLEVKDLTITSSNINKVSMNSYDWVSVSVSGYSNVFASNNRGSHSTTSYLKFPITVSGKLTFNYKVSSESNYDKLTIQILNSSGSSVTTICNAISGSGSWNSASYYVTKGQFFYAYYSKDSSANSNDDRGYVANMKIVAEDGSITSSNIGIINMGSYNWSSTTYSGYENVFRSTNYNVNNSTSYLKFQIKMTGTMSFNYKVSSETNYDKLTIQILNNSGSSIRTVCSSISGSGSWQSASFDVTEGQYFYAYYSKDGSQHKNDDRAYVANMKIKSNEVPKYIYKLPEIVDSAGNYKIVARVTDSTGNYAPVKVVVDSFSVYPIVANLTNCSMTSRNYAKQGTTATIDLVASVGYSVPEEITVKMGGQTLTQGTGYTYSQAKSQIVINNVSGNIEITVVAVEGTIETITLNNRNYNYSYSGDLIINGVTIGSTTDYILGSVITISYDYADYRYIYYSVGSDSSVKLTGDVSNDRITIANVTKSGDDIISFRIISAAEDVSIYINSGCLAEGTYVTLANGKKKRIEDITYDDELLVWDFDKGCFAKAKPFWIKIEEKADAVMRCEFEDGTIIETIRGHAVYSVEENKFLNTYKDEFKPMFTHTINEKGEKVLLVKKEVVYKNVKHYNFHTNYYMNNYSNGVLTSIGENNVYPIKDMKFVKEERELIPYEVFEKAGVPRRYYDGLRLAETPKDMVQNRIELVKELLEPVEVKFEQK